MKNTEAASVELMTAPTKKLSSKENPSAKWQNAPTSAAVSTTPSVGKQRRLAHDRPGLLPAGAEPAVEHDEDERRRTDLLGKGVIVKGDAQQTIGAKEHAEQNKRQQHGHA